MSFPEQVFGPHGLFDAVNFLLVAFAIPHGWLFCIFQSSFQSFHSLRCRPKTLLQFGQLTAELSVIPNELEETATVSYVTWKRVCLSTLRNPQQNTSFFNYYLLKQAMNDYMLSCTWIPFVQKTTDCKVADQSSSTYQYTKFYMRRCIYLID